MSVWRLKKHLKSEKEPEKTDCDLKYEETDLNEVWVDKQMLEM